VAVFVGTFINLFLLALFVLVFARVIVSWVDPQGRYQATMFIVQTTEPLLSPVRRVLPKTGMVDFSATVVLLILFALMRAF
jgi:YggT family protein